MRKIPPLSAIRVFEAAARHQNFTRTAEELGMTQAAVSYQIKILEERIGNSLFRRHKGRLSLTDFGSRIAPLVTDSFNTLERAFELASVENERTLTISTAPSFATNWLAPRIGRFQLARPQLAVRLRADNHYIDFAAEDVDVAVRSGVGNWPGLIAHFLMRSAVQPFASAEFIARHGPVDTAEDLKRLPLLSPDDLWWNLWFIAAGSSPQNQTTSPGIRLDSQAMEAHAAMAGHGICIINALMWQADIASGRLVPLGPFAVAEHSFWLVYPEHRRQSVKIREFRKWLDDEVSMAAEGQPTLLFEPPERSLHTVGQHKEM